MGKSRKVSLKSDKKVAVAKENWVVTRNTHIPLVSDEVFERAQINLGRNAKNMTAIQGCAKVFFQA